MHARTLILLTLGTTSVLFATCVNDALAQACSSDSNFCNLMDAERLHVSTRDVHWAQTVLESELAEAAQHDQKELAASRETDLGLLCALQGKYTEAKNHCEKSLAERKQLFGMRDISVAESYNALSLIALNAKDYATSEQFVEEAIVTAQASPEKNGLRLADSYDILARTAFDQGNAEKAEDPAFKSYHLRSTLLGAGHPAVAQSAYMLALYHAYKGDVTRASELLDESIAHGDSLQKAKSYFAKSRLLAVQANAEESKKFFFQALDLRKATLGDASSETAIKTQYAKFLWDHSMWLDAIEIRKTMPLHVDTATVADLDSRLLIHAFDRSDIPAQFNPNYIYLTVSLIVGALGLIGICVFLPQFMYMPNGSGVLEFLKATRRQDLNRNTNSSAHKNLDSNPSGTAQNSNAPVPSGNQQRPPRSQTATNSKLALLPQRDSKPRWTPGE